MNTAARTNNEDGISTAELIVPSVIGVVIGVAVAAVLLFIVGAIVYSTSDPNKLVTAASMLILAVSSFAAGFAGSKKGSSLLPGIIAGAVFALVTLTASLISGGDGAAIPAPYSYLVRFGAFAVSTLGAYLASRGDGGRRFASSPRKPKIKKM